MTFVPHAAQNPHSVAGLEWTRAQAEDALAADLRTAMLEAARFPWWAGLDPVRQAVIVGLCFNMGRPRLLGFRRMVAAIERRHWRTAGFELVQSRWATQVGPTRAGRLRRMLDTGRDD